MILLITQPFSMAETRFILQHAKSEFREFKNYSQLFNKCMNDFYNGSRALLAIVPLRFLTIYSCAQTQVHIII